MTTQYKLALLPGDGIGPEVIESAVECLQKAAPLDDLEFSLTEYKVGGCALDAYKVPLRDGDLEEVKKADSVLLGAVGGPKWEGLDYAIRPERALLRLRAELELFANLRPATVFPETIDASALKREVVEGIDIMVLRELTGGIYFGTPKGVDTDPDGNRRGVNTMVYTEPEIERIARLAFEMARQRRGKVTSVDKANVLEVTELWRDIVTKLHKDEYSDVELNHMYVDNAAMQLIRNPRQFDVLVTGNLFGDILSDEAAMLTGSIGLLPSASLGKAKEGGGPRLGMYEPVHGSAPDIAGQDKANPIATVLSVAMMLRYSFGVSKSAEAIEKAVSKVLAEGYRTADIAEPGAKIVGTKEIGKALVDAI
ncbi:MAG: 3-isopropylmalate dehydrogenase [Chrysiogenetes bacterium]|nr:3-isopropylmalate dehydrogenase [Chrysiogenetes bacterium]